MQSWEEHEPNHSRFLAYLDKRNGGGSADSHSIYRTARRRAWLLVLSLIANVILLANLWHCIQSHK